MTLPRVICRKRASLGKFPETDSNFILSLFRLRPNHVENAFAGTVRIGNSLPYPVIFFYRVKNRPVNAVPASHKLAYMIKIKGCCVTFITTEKFSHPFRAASSNYTLYGRKDILRVNCLPPDPRNSISLFFDAYTNLKPICPVNLYINLSILSPMPSLLASWLF